MLIRMFQRAPRKRRVAEMLALFTFIAALLMGLEGCTKEEIPVPEAELALSGTGHTKAIPVPSQMLVSGLQGTSGSTVGPDGFLYVTEGAVGLISRIDPTTGDVSTFASGLPKAIAPIGGPIDVVFRNGTAYALVTLVGADVGGTETVGIYRIDSPTSHTVIADIGTFNVDNPPTADFSYFLPEGVLYAIEAYRDGFLVTDGHLNRVLYVTTDGEITILRAFDNIVPTGLALSGNVIYIAESGPRPHNPEDGKVISFVPASPLTKEVASGAPLLVDVEVGFPHKFYALSQGDWDGVNPGDPAIPGTGSLVRVHFDGTFTTISTGLNLPTSLEFIGNTAYIVNLLGEVWTVEGINSTYPPE